MATYIEGIDISYNVAQTLDINGGFIVRKPSSQSNDDFAFSASEFIADNLGKFDNKYNGYSHHFSIFNGSPHAITQTALGEGLTMLPNDSKEIASGTRATFSMMQISATPPNVLIAASD